MKRYKLIDLQGCYFMSDTHEEPMTELEFRERFWALDDARTLKFRDFTLDFIREVWEVEFEEVKNGL